MQRTVLASRKKDRDDGLVWATWAAAWVALIAAAAGGYTGFEAHKTRVEDERPFVLANTVEDTAEEIHLRSSGKSPALRVTVVCFDAPDENQISWKKVGDSNPPGRFIALLPQQSTLADCTLEGPSGDKETVYGIVKYDDEENHHYQLPFCYNGLKSEDKKESKVRWDFNICEDLAGKAPPVE